MASDQVKGRLLLEPDLQNREPYGVVAPPSTPVFRIPLWVLLLVGAMHLPLWLNVWGLGFFGAEDRLFVMAATKLFATYALWLSIRWLNRGQTGEWAFVVLMAVLANAVLAAWCYFLGTFFFSREFAALEAVIVCVLGIISLARYRRAQKDRSRGTKGL